MSRRDENEWLDRMIEGGDDDLEEAFDVSDYDVDKLVEGFLLTPQEIAELEEYSVDPLALVEEVDEEDLDTQEAPAPVVFDFPVDINRCQMLVDGNERAVKDMGVTVNEGLLVYMRLAVSLSVEVSKRTGVPSGQVFEAIQAHCLNSQLEDMQAANAMENN